MYLSAHPPPTRRRTLGVFAFVIALVVITTIGKVVSEVAGARRLPRPDPPPASSEVDDLREALNDVSTRLHKLEEERDFYRALLEAPKDSPGAAPE